jgi:LemA protein
MEVLYVILGLIALVVIVLIAIYNNLVAKRQQCNQAFADIDVQLKQRRDLVPNLVETVKGYASHERQTLDAVINARNSAQQAKGVHDQAQAEQVLGGAIRGLLALSEAYPDLKANTNFQQLQVQLEGVEDKLAAARRFFNSAVADFNQAIQSFPANLLAGGWGFVEREFFDLGDTERVSLSVAPEVKF